MDEMKVTPSSGNVFSDLGFDAEEAENLRIRSKLMISLCRRIEELGISQNEAADYFGVAKSRISDLVRGKIGRFTIDALINMHAHAGMKVSVEIEMEEA